MIFDELYDLKQYIISDVKVNCDIGDMDIEPERYPFIKIIPDEEIEAFYGMEKLSSIDMPVNLKIIVAKGNEIKAFETLDRLIEKINQFNKYKGHMLSGTIAPEYVDETKTYEINVLYNLKLMEHDDT